MSTSDPARSCENCACFAWMFPDGTTTTEAALAADGQSVCRRNVPGARQVRVDLPQLQANGQPALDRLDRPVTKPATIFQFGYQPTPPWGICYDGWRPKGTRPGDPWK